MNGSHALPQVSRGRRLAMCWRGSHSNRVTALVTRIRSESLTLQFDSGVVCCTSVPWDRLHDSLVDGAMARGPPSQLIFNASTLLLGNAVMRLFGTSSDLVLIPPSPLEFAPLSLETDVTHTVNGPHIFSGFPCAKPARKTVPMAMHIQDLCNRRNAWSCGN